MNDQNICSKVCKVILLFGYLFSLSLFGEVYDDKRIDIALEKVFPLLTKDEISLSPLVGGYSYAKNFLISASGKRYVLRLQKESESTFKLKRELYMMQQASQLSIAPKLYYASEDGKCIIMEFIEGGTLTLKEGRSVSFAKKFGKAISKVHQIPKDVGLSDKTFFDSMESFYSEIEHNLKKYENMGFDEINDVLSVISIHQADLERLNRTQVNIHGDLNPRNILFSNGVIYFIDWTESLWEEPFHDLADYAILLNYDEDLERVMLQSYLGRNLTAEDLKAYGLCKKIQYARLALGACHIALQRIDLYDETVEPATILKNWFQAVEMFASGTSELYAQYFYEVMRAALLEMY